jgi:hypothetical protein
MLLFHIYSKEITTNGVLELVGLTFESVANNSAFDNSLWRWDLMLWVGFQSALATL